MAILNNSNAISSGGYNLTNSLRFRSSASAYLSRTPASNGDRQKWTWSSWVKRGASGVRQGIFVANPSGAVYWGLEFDASNALNIYDSNAGGTTALTTTALYRDFGAWYHVVVAVDTTQATASNRTKLYINGNQVTAFSVANYPSQNSNTQINTGSLAHYIGNWNPSVANLPFDGYMSEVNFIDGQALTPSSFGATDATTGVWQPTKYTGTYGNNGFYLNFSDIALTSGSNAGLGKDFSGNGNYWNTNNISVTAGSTYDAMSDVPTLTSATVANYAVLNPLEANGGTISSANLKLVTPATSFTPQRATMGVSSGKWYWEVTFGGGTNNACMIGIVDITTAITSSGATSSNSWSYYGFNGNKYTGGASSAYGASFTTGDIIGVALDMDAGTLVFYKNNTSQGTAASSGLTGKTLTAFFDNGGAAQTVDINFGQRPFSYTPPTGFVRLNTYNLPDSTIKKGSSYMDTKLYTGTNANQSISSFGFSPDLIWIKNRNDVESHHLVDSVRGNNKFLISNSTVAERTGSLNNGYNQVNLASNGFDIVSNGLNDELNLTSRTYASWGWDAGSSTVTNTSGSLSSQVRANPTAGFSIVTYTGTGANATVGHGLGVAPKMIIVKSRSLGTEHWAVYHTSLGNTQYILLNLTNAASSAANLWNNTTPTSSVFSILTNSSVNTSAATYVAYCWAEIAGFSKFGSYTGNGSADGPFVYLGFRPRFILYKSSNLAEGWIMFDTSRNTYNLTDSCLIPYNPTAEFAGAPFNRSMDILSNGFKPRGTDTNINGSGSTYIYMAFAENPLKNSLAR